MEYMRPNTFTRALLMGGALMFGLWALSPIVVISAGERGVKTTFGGAAGSGHAHHGRAPAKG